MLRERLVDDDSVSMVAQSENADDAEDRPAYAQADDGRYSDRNDAGDDEDGSDEKAISFVLQGYTAPDNDCMDCDGLAKLQKYPFGGLKQFLFDRQFASSTDDIRTVVQKNLVVLFQAHLLYEDCFTEAAVKSKKESMDCAMQSLQAVVKMPPPNSSVPANKQLVAVLLEKYASARREYIIKELKGKKIPPLPEDPLTALLIKLIDRYLCFTVLKIPVHGLSSSDGLDDFSDVDGGDDGDNRSCAFERVEERFQIMQKMLAPFLKTCDTNRATDTPARATDPTDSASKLWTTIAPMIRSDILDEAFWKPWYYEQWRARHGLSKPVRLFLNKNRETGTMYATEHGSRTNKQLPQKHMREDEQDEGQPEAGTKVKRKKAKNKKAKSKKDE